MPATQEKPLAERLTPETHTQVHTIETTGRAGDKRTYRDFLTDSCQKDITHNRLVYSMSDCIELTNKTEHYDSCRTYAYFVRHKESGEVRVQASACRLRWCPLCIRTKRFVIAQEVAGWLKTIKKPKFLTFTLRHNDDPLRDRVRDIYRFYRNIRRTKWFKKNVRGGVWFFQITKNQETNQWHPHIHCLVDSNFLPKEKLSELWELITGDSKIVDIRAVKDRGKTAEYVARYATAPCRLSDFSIDDSIEIVQTLHGKRLCGTWGSGRQMSFRIKQPEDWEDWERIANWWTVWENKANPHWCNIVKLAFLHGRPLEYRPPPDLQGPIPWNKELENDPGPSRAEQMRLF